MSQHNIRQIEITRWQGSQNPSVSAMTRLMNKEGLTPYDWHGTPNSRQAIRSNNYHRIIYLTAGTLEIVLPDLNQSAKLRVGDRIFIPAGMRHGLICGSSGVVCLEAALKRA